MENRTELDRCGSTAGTAGLLRRWLRWGAACVLTGAAVIGCGGGVGSNGTGQTTQGSGAGTVTGFGSIYVDGVAYDDSAAEVEVESADGSVSRTETKLGQRVELVYALDGSGTAGYDRALRIRVQASVVGSVERVDSDGFVVLGQTIKTNTDAAAGPVTVFETASGAPADLSALVAGAAVEVHAIRRDGSGGSALQATRVELLDSLTQVRVSGRVTATASGAFSLGGLQVTTAQATFVPSGSSAPSVGEWVTVLAQAADYDQAAATLAARRVRIGDRVTQAVLDDEAQFSGYVAELSDDGSRFKIGSVTVQLAAGTRYDPSGSTVVAGQYVRVEGSYQADGSLLARELHFYSEQDHCELHGSVFSYDSTANTFRVRDTLVRLAENTSWQGCTAQTLQNGAYVEVKGQYGTGGMVASSVACSSDGGAAGRVIERHGQVAGLDRSARRFTLSHSDGGETPSLVQVRWTDTTYFRAPLSVSSLVDGQDIEVEGVLEGSGDAAVLVATKIKQQR